MTYIYLPNLPLQLCPFITLYDVQAGASSVSHGHIPHLFINDLNKQKYSLFSYLAAYAPLC